MPRIHVVAETLPDGTIVTRDTVRIWVPWIVDPVMYEELEKLAAKSGKNLRAICEERLAEGVMRDLDEAKTLPDWNEPVAKERRSSAKASTGKTTSPEKEALKKERLELAAKAKAEREEKAKARKEAAEKAKQEREAKAAKAKAEREEKAVEAAKAKAAKDAEAAEVEKARLAKLREEAIAKLRAEQDKTKQTVAATA